MADPSAFQLLELTTDSVAAYRPDSTVLYVNPTTEKTFGMAREQLVGKRLFDLFPDALGNPFHQTFVRVAASRTAEHLEHYYEPFRRWFDNEFYVAGDVIWVVARDVTSRKDAERRLSVLAEASSVFATFAGDIRLASKQLARIAGEALGDAAVVRLLREDGRVLDATGTWGRTPALESALARLAPVSVSPAFSHDTPTHPRLLGREELQRMLSGLPETSRDVARDLHPHSLVLAPVRSGERLLGMLAVARADGHTTLPLAEADLQLAEDLAARAALAVTAVRNLAEANRRKDEFLALLGHELRNPLAPITTALHLMKLRGLGEAAKEREVIERQVSHMTQLVDDLLDTSRIVRGMLTLHRESILLSTVLERAVEMASPLLEERRHRFRMHSPEIPIRVHADRTRLAQVFSNLLTNAARYTDPGGEVTVDVEVSESTDTAIVTVSDSGAGIPSELQDAIFEPFFQAGRPPHAHGGLGLGLPLVRSLTRLHGGTVSAHSDGPGKGSRFRVELPLLRAPESIAEAAPSRGREQSREPRHILVVDDNRDALELLAELLRADGHEVETALDGAQALERIDEQRFDTYILDIALPVLDGYELARRIRQKHGTGARLAALTGYGQAKDRERALAAGFDAHFVKPVSIEALRDFLRSPEE